MTQSPPRSPSQQPARKGKPLAEARAEQEQPAGEFEISHDGSTQPPKPDAK